MRIGIDARMYGSRVTGIGTYVQQLTDAMAVELGGDQLVLLLRVEEAKHMPRRPNVLVATTAIPWYGWREQLRLPAVMASLHCDLWHVPNFNVPVGYRGRLVVTIHDLTPLRFPGPHQRRSRWRRAAYRLVLNSAVVRAKKIIAVSQATASAIARRWPSARSRVTVIYPGLSSAFRALPDHGIIKATLDRYRIRQPYIFYTGVWRDHKNLPGLIAAFRLMREQYGFSGQLVFGGLRQGEDAAIAPALAGLPPDAVTLPGFIPDADLPAMFQGAAVTVIPSFSEGFGLIGIESLACGTPVAASQTTSVPEVLGPAGRYFPPNQPSAIAETIRSLLQAPTRQAVLAAAPSVLTRYAWETAAKQTLAVYRAA